jgi:6-phosphogluconolactonase
VSAARTVVVHADASLLAAAAAARLVTRLVDAQAARGHAHVVLTGGGAGIAALSALAASPARDAVDWSRLDVWWGDERFLPAGHADRNETQARAALLDHVRLPAERVHPMPAADGRWGEDVDAAAAYYAQELAGAAGSGEHGGVPAFDVLMLGMGPDGHVASLFPGQPALYEQERTVVGVHGSPKPPPVRVSLTFPALCSAHEVWFLAAGPEKAAAVAMALGDAGPYAIPAVGAAGTSSTLWLLDRAAASQVPPAITRIASP